jgi:hypothetical protein
LGVDIDARTSTPGEFAGVGAALRLCGRESLDAVNTHGDPITGCGWCKSSLGGGVDGTL